MKYLEKYEKFNTPVNEEFLGALYNVAKGALKEFLSKISEPFKTSKDDIKKIQSQDLVINYMISKMDSLLKSATDAINKAEDETALSAMRDDFGKEIDFQIEEFDKEIKENKGTLQSLLIAARVAFGIVRKKDMDVKVEFDKKIVAATDIEAKKKVTIEELTVIVNDFKKNVKNSTFFKKIEAEYKMNNKIQTTSEYKVGDEVIYLKDGQKMESWNALTDEQKKSPLTDDIAKVIVNIKKISKIDGDNYTFIGKDNKEIIKTSADLIGKSESSGVSDEEKSSLTKKLGDINSTNPENIRKVSDFVDFISNPENKNKYSEIEKIIKPTE
jgi:CHASE3 domain sensor protein